MVVHPNSKNPRIENNPEGPTHIYVHEPALGGKANTAAIKVLSELYKTPKSHVRLLSGTKSKLKVFEIDLK
ncbi:MAG: DUF167 domain-containing protein [Patescibacteria group bacterium]|jgi:hypothetical protein